MRLRFNLINLIINSCFARLLAAYKDEAEAKDVAANKDGCGNHMRMKIRVHDKFRMPPPSPATTTTTTTRATTTTARSTTLKRIVASSTSPKTTTTVETQPSAKTQAVNGG